jgi:hypothetical protein
LVYQGKMTTVFCVVLLLDDCRFLWDGPELMDGQAITVITASG